MAQTGSHHSAHVSRVHHHRNRVAAARAAVDDAAAQVVAEHYDNVRSAAPQAPPGPPLGGSPAVAPPTV